MADISFRDLSLLWHRARIASGFDPAVWRYDVLGNPIRWTDYGNRDSQFGWEADHIVPIARGGSDQLSNLQVLQWEANVAKGDKPMIPLQRRTS